MRCLAELAYSPRPYLSLQGLAFGDVNSDGLPDVYITSAMARHESYNPTAAETSSNLCVCGDVC